MSIYQDKTSISILDSSIYREKHAAFKKIQVYDYLYGVYLHKWRTLDLPEKVTNDDDIKISRLHKASNSLSNHRRKYYLFLTDCLKIYRSETAWNGESNEVKLILKIMQRIKG